MVRTNTTTILVPRATLFAVALVFNTAACNTHAQTNDAAMERVVVSASRLNLTAEAVAQHVTVLSREDMVLGGYASVAELLAASAGLSVDRSGRTGGYGSLYLRGADPSHVAILIDGVRQNDPLSSRGSAVDLNTLTIADIERIEIVRGSSGVAQGDALAGLIHIHTRAPDRTAASAQAEVGGDGRAAASVRVSMPNLSASAVRSEDGGRFGSTRNTSANLSWRFASGDHWGVALQARSTRTRNTAFPDDSGGALFATRNALEQRVADSVQGGLRGWWRVIDGATLEWSLSHFERSERDSNPGIAPGARDPSGFPAIGSDTRYGANNAQLLWRQRLSPTLSAVIGGEIERERGSLDSVIDYGRFKIPARFDQARSPFAIFSEIRYERDGWSANAGLRSLTAAGFATQWHPGLAVEHQFAAAGIAVGASLTTATKLPSFYALGHPLIGNPGLRPERALQQEIYVASRAEAPFNLRLTAFSSRYRELVDFDPGPPPKLVNRSRINVDGVEASAGYRFRGGARISADATWMDVGESAGTPPLRFRPRLQGGTRLSIPVGDQMSLHVSARYIGRRFDSSIPTADRWLGGYTQVNANAVTAINNRWVKDLRLTLAVDNLLDRHAEESIGNLIGSRRIRVGVQWSWA